MKRQQIFSIFLALVIGAGASVALSGCSGRVYYVDPATGQAVAPPTEEDTTASVAESSAESSEEASEKESSEEDVSEEEVSEEDVSEEESAEESSEEESSEEESVDDGVKRATITFRKPDEWGDTVNAKIYEKGGIADADSTKEMTDNGDGTYSYTVEYENEEQEMVVIFSDPSKPKNQYPKANALDVEDGKTYEVE